jgi:hypothetical protein
MIFCYKGQLIVKKYCYRIFFDCYKIKTISLALNINCLLIKKKDFTIFFEIPTYIPTSMIN